MVAPETVHEPVPSEVAQVAAALGADAGAGTSARYSVAALGRGVAGATAGLWRVQGDGWSAVCKLAAHSERGHRDWRTSESETDVMYWRREAVAYCSGFLGRVVNDSGSGITTPRLLACFEHDDGSVSVWLEDVRGLPGLDWPLVGHAAAARALGRLQGGLVVADGVPREPWLSRGWLRAYLGRRTQHVEVLLDDSQWRDVPVAAREAVALRDEFVGLWHDRDRLLAALDALPQSFCHHDFYPDNLFGVTDRDGASRVVALDWAYCGLGALGEDVGNLVADSMLDLAVEPSSGPMLGQLCVGAYLLGLADAAWGGDQDAVRLAVAATAAVKYVWILPHVLMQARGDFGPLRWERGRVHSVEEAVAWRIEVCRQLASWYQEAGRLLDG